MAIDYRLTPTLHRKYSDVILSFCIHDLALAYMFLITFNNLPFISCDKSFCQRSGILCLSAISMMFVKIRLAVCMLVGMVV